ncbi:multidrug resistance efflux pump [Sphaerochaeta pleomorpha str. Grapes]|uniref:Multidrug resistance efflux pump n=1 Tax=Sphaerochaeta pleomorpha (strain ATCC BAA-1885 / DSM 22778 / Grapes) TaxID=158190 RepID=G8QX67_SPHPG|nr:efflux RND transporter periplasmic adaptor subunit [Sphaerochaeta pleomorpha]AEV30652.1 multidrug resistance efflux pump [Sphaerochaeta pleomorpha str. Grapes]
MKKITIILFILATVVSCTPNGEIKIAEGSFESTEVIVSAEGNGRILSFNAEEGANVIKGQILGKIDDRQLVLKRGQLLSMREKVETQRPDIGIQVAAMEEQLAVAKAENTRIANLVAAKAVSEKQLDDSKAQVTILELQLDALKSTLKQNVEGLAKESESLSFQIAQLDDQISKCVITSPIDGTLMTSYAQEGELASVGKSLFAVADLDCVYLRAYITAAELTTCKLNDTVKVRVNYGEGGKRYYEGKLSWISEKAEFTPKTVQTKDERATLVYAVKVSLVNDGYLKLGMYGAIVEGK